MASFGDIRRCRREVALRDRNNRAGVGRRTLPGWMLFGFAGLARVSDAIVSVERPVPIEDRTMIADCVPRLASRTHLVVAELVSDAATRHDPPYRPSQGPAAQFGQENAPKARRPPSGRFTPATKDVVEEVSCQHAKVAQASHGHPHPCFLICDSFQQDRRR